MQLGAKMNELRVFLNDSNIKFRNSIDNKHQVYLECFDGTTIDVVELDDYMGSSYLEIGEWVNTSDDESSLECYAVTPSDVFDRVVRL